MANDIVIRVEGLGKKYLIGHQMERERYTTLRDVMAERAKSVWRRTADMARGRPLVHGHATEEVWALKDVSFEVKRGEVLGIIGRNGAGKSTLLKILSRITEPSEGRVRIKGRVASLLEVGTGFHPELTGRENIYLNGAILGMTRAEMRRKFDEIVAFAEVEKFLDTPIKRYSSGMYVRLAFAVAAHLEPEILIVDEVLAVGDVEFQKKCLGTMSEVARRGRTVIFVSHNIAALKRLSEGALLLQNGQLIFAGPMSDALSQYLLPKGSLINSRPQYTGTNDSASGPRIANVTIVTSSGSDRHSYPEPLRIEISIVHAEPMREACLSFQILNSSKEPIVHATAYPPDVQIGKLAGGTDLTCIIPHLRLNIGSYSLKLYLSEPPAGRVWEVLDDVCPFVVERHDKDILWGWREHVCAYFEDLSWTTRSAEDQSGN
jgi:lipopolysaccharide transport system ATP-binding protein